MRWLSRSMVRASLFRSWKFVLPIGIGLVRKVEVLPCVTWILYNLCRRFALSRSNNLVSIAIRLTSLGLVTKATGSAGGLSSIQHWMFSSCDGKRRLIVFQIIHLTFLSGIFLAFPIFLLFHNKFSRNVSIYRKDKVKLDDASPDISLSSGPIEPLGRDSGSDPDSSHREVDTTPVHHYSLKVTRAQVFSVRRD